MTERTMTLTPFLETAAHIQLHAAAAVFAVLAGPFVIYGRKSRLHKVLGYLWVLAMAVTAISSFWITNFGVIGPLSPIHGLSVLALWSLFQGLRHIFRGNITAHQTTMRSLYWTGLMVAGLFTFLPGRIVNRSLFPEIPEAGYLVIALGGAALATYLYNSRRLRRAVAG
jgi:uncharacterized membrane protein